MKKSGKFISDLIFGVLGLVVMNAVLSLFVNPNLEHSVGTEAFGKILFFNALAVLLAGSLGAGINYGRMKVFSEERKTENGEYNIGLLIAAELGTLITILAILIKGDSAGASWIGLIALVIATTVRYYADVEYRLNMNYKRFCLFYVLIGAGYLLGWALFKGTGRWILIFLTGEIAGIVFVAVTGIVFRKPFFKRTDRFKNHLATMGTISGSYFLSDFVSAADRFLFPLVLVNGDELTSLFYFASVVGKAMSLLSTPLNGVLTGYISREEGGLSVKRFLKLIGIMLGVFLVVTAGSVVGSHLFVWLFYPGYYDTVKPLFILANAGQVIFFICNTLMVVVLRYTHERNQIIVSVVYILCFFAVTIPLIRSYGVFGMAWGLFIVNTLKFLMFTVLGIIGIRGEKK